MKHLNTYTFITLSKPNKRKNGVYNLFFSTFFALESPTNLDNLDKMRDILNRDPSFPKILIGFHILLDHENNNLPDHQETINIEGENTRFIVKNVKITTFFSYKFLNELIEFLQKKPEASIFLYGKELSIDSIKAVFKEYDINISGGNNTLKHLLSPQQFLLSKIISLYYVYPRGLVNKSFTEIGAVKDHSRVSYNFTSEKDRLLLQRIKDENKAYLDLCVKDTYLKNLADYFSTDYEKKFTTKYSYSYNTNKKSNRGGGEE